jgi:hypothetical protein
LYSGVGIAVGRGVPGITVGKGVGNAVGKGVGIAVGKGVGNSVGKGVGKGTYYGGLIGGRIFRPPTFRTY